MQWLTFNLFQRLVRSWERVHPYNGAQVVRIRGPVDLSLLQGSFAGALGDLGLGPMQIANGRYRFLAVVSDRDPTTPVLRYTDEPDHRTSENPALRSTSEPASSAINASLHDSANAFASVRQLPGDIDLGQHLAESINQPFLDDDLPFRPFVIPRAGGCDVGLVYRHWLADSVSIRRLLKLWVTRGLGFSDSGDSGNSGDSSKLALAPTSSPCLFLPGYRDLFSSTHAALDADQRLLRWIRHYLSLRTVRKACLCGQGDYPTGVVIHALPGGVAPMFRRAARQAGATVGDLFQAALGAACHRLLPLQYRAGRRDVAVGSIVNLRPDSTVQSSDDFGVCLGFSHVICRQQHLQAPEALLTSVASQNRAHRREGLAANSLPWLIAAELAAKAQEPDRDLYRFYRKEIPLAAGLSNVRVSRDDWGKIGPQLIGYFRVSPTGPMAPAAVSLTTLDGDMNLVLTYRRSMFNLEQAREFAAEVAGGALRFCGGCRDGKEGGFCGASALSGR